MPRTLENRLERIEKLEKELLEKAQKSLPSGHVYLTDMFLLGATQRTLAQSQGFRQLIESRNFPSATILLRTQIDTAMRINELTLMGDREGNLKRLMEGEVRFDQLTTGKLKDGGKTERLSDAYLRKQLSEKYPWVDKIHTETSDFVHLSFRHVWTAIARTEDETRMAYFAISGTDPVRDESDYYGVCDAFFEVSKVCAALRERRSSTRQRSSKEDWATVSRSESH
jgi:hypothetical protein